MRRNVLLFTVFIFTLPLLAQKPSVDTSTFNKWPLVYGEKLSPDGQFITYSIGRGQEGSQIFASTRPSGWKELYSRCSQADFLANSKYAIFRTADDSLFLLKLGTGYREFVGRTDFYTLVKDKGNHEWLIYQETKGGKRLIVRESSGGKLQSEKNVTRYLPAENSGVLLLQFQEQTGSEVQQSLCRWNLLSGERTIIWRGAQADNYVFDDAGQQIAFFAEEQDRHAIWYCKAEMKQAEKCVSDATAGIDSNLLIYDGPLFFSRDGKSLFFQFTEKPFKKANPNAPRVDIWSYKDLHLQEEQLANLKPRTFAAVVRTGTKYVYRLQLDDEQFKFDHDLENCNQYVLVTKNGSNIDMWWNLAARSSVYIESVRDGSRILLKKDIPYAQDWSESLGFSLSPDQKYVVYYDPFENNYFSYEIAGKITRNVTQGLDVRWRDHSSHWEAPVCGYPIGIANWLERDAAVLIYDAFDIWQIDPSGIKKPLNLTRGYGLANHTQLRLTSVPNHWKMPIPPDANLLLRAFDTVTKYGGFYSKILGQSTPPLLLTMGPYIYNDPIKAEQADTWLVQRQSATEAPNVFMTRDWRNFAAVSNVQPQRAYNWLTAELVTWVLPDGGQGQGILYKPENFDIHKQYPMLIHYYEEFSQELYRFKWPKAIEDEINIPYFVSKGYLVFIPDIHYTIGTPGESVVNAVMSGARYLCRNPWVDSTRMGLQGHSFGGWETNYLVTHTHIFAAAAEGAGTSDLVSSYGGLGGAGYSRQNGYEVSQGRIRASLWQRPDLYIKGSPIFKADQVTTPLLMMHNKKDGSVPWAQAVEFFTALRRLGRKVWMLQYDEGTHFVDGKEALDYTIRMTQFFDHFLMGLPAPRWMIESMPAIRKGEDMGYELDKNHHTP